MLSLYRCLVHEVTVEEQRSVNYQCSELPLSLVGTTAHSEPRYLENQSRNLFGLNRHAEFFAFGNLVIKKPCPEPGHFRCKANAFLVQMSR